MIAHQAAVESSITGDDGALAENLEAESAAGMLTICGAAFALDAFYAALKERSTRVAKISIYAGKRRSTRHKIIAEALRREFRVGRVGFVNLRNMLKEVFRFRTYAVHPKADFTLPVVKPEINKSTEWRFVAFEAPSAQTALRAPSPS